eukprot:COSAG05_NODE_673_length_7989_cov_2.973638_7_plen_897_part_00
MCAAARAAIWKRYTVTYVYAPAPALAFRGAVGVARGMRPAAAPRGALVALGPLLVVASVSGQRGGCTDSAATNYQPMANVDRGQCAYNNTILRSKLEAPGDTTVYVYAGAWPDLLVSQVSVQDGCQNPVTLLVPDNGKWIVQGRPLAGAMKREPAVPRETDGTGVHVQELPYRLKVVAGGELFLRYAAFKSSWDSCFHKGGFLHADGGTARLTGVLFTRSGNTVSTAVTGGGIYAENRATVELTMAVFDHLKTSKGGGIFMDTSTLIVTDSKFIALTATAVPRGGSAIKALGSNIRLDGVDFILCQSGNSVVDFSENNPDFVPSQPGDPMLGLLIKSTQFDPYKIGGSVFVNSSWAKTVGGCAEHPCEPGFSCQYEKSSLQCTQCALGTFGSDGLKCSPCAAGTQPNSVQPEVPAQSKCVACSGSEYSPNGVCVPCPSPNVPTNRYTKCTRCPPGRGPNTEHTECVHCAKDHIHSSASRIKERICTKSACSKLSSWVDFSWLSFVLFLLFLVLACIFFATLVCYATKFSGLVHVLRDGSFFATAKVFIGFCQIATLFSTFSPGFDELTRSYVTYTHLLSLVSFNLPRLFKFDCWYLSFYTKWMLHAFGIPIFWICVVAINYLIGIRYGPFKTRKRWHFEWEPLFQEWAHPEIMGEVARYRFIRNIQSAMFVSYTPVFNAVLRILLCRPLSESSSVLMDDYSVECGTELHPNARHDKYKLVALILTVVLVSVPVWSVWNALHPLRRNQFRSLCRCRRKTIDGNVLQECNPCGVFKSDTPDATSKIGFCQQRPALWPWIPALKASLGPDNDEVVDRLAQTLTGGDLLDLIMEKPGKKFKPRISCWRSFLKRLKLWRKSDNWKKLKENPPDWSKIHYVVLRSMEPWAVLICRELNRSCA